MKLFVAALSLLWALSARAQHCPGLFPGVPEDMQTHFDLYTNPKLLPHIERVEYRATFSGSIIKGVVSMYSSHIPVSPAIQVRVKYTTRLHYENDLLAIERSFFHPDFGVTYAYRLILAHLLHGFPATQEIQFTLPNNSVTRSLIQELMAQGRNANDVFSQTPMGVVLDQFGFTVKGVKVNLKRVEEGNETVAQALAHIDPIFFSAKRRDLTIVPRKDRPFKVEPPSEKGL